jgi:hypothetical protein
MHLLCGAESLRSVSGSEGGAPPTPRPKERNENRYLSAQHPATTRAGAPLPSVPGRAWNRIKPST